MEKGILIRLNLFKMPNKNMFDLQRPKFRGKLLCQYISPLRNLASKSVRNISQAWVCLI